jgi:predicted nuclease of predicted toxin-antitoxin system
LANQALHDPVSVYLDADVDPELARQARQRGFDVISAYEVGNGRLLDEDQLAYAAEHDRVIFTHNARDFAPLFDEWWETNHPHAGILVSQQLPVGVLVRRLLRMLNTVTADNVTNTYRNLAEFAERE